MPFASPGPPVVHRLIYETRYDLGNLYFDRCGAVINAILRQHPGWEVNDVSPQTGSLRESSTGAAFSFNNRKLDLSHEQPAHEGSVMPATDFARLADAFTATVRDGLALADFTRIGFRVWRLFGTESLEAANETIISLGLLSSERVAVLGIGELAEAVPRFLVRDDQRSTRVSVVAVERKTQADRAVLEAAHVRPERLPEKQTQARVRKAAAERDLREHPQYAVLVDMDHFLEDPAYPELLRIQDFVSSSFQWGESASKAIMGLKTRR